VVKNSGITVLDASIKMAFKLFEANEKMKSAEETYRNMFLNAQIGLFRTDIKTGLVLDANDCLAKFAGYKDRNDLLSDSFNMAEHYVNIKDREIMVSLLRKFGEYSNLEVQFTRRDGSLIWIRYSGKLIPDKGWIEGVSEDVTLRRDIEQGIIIKNEELEAANEELNAAMEEMEAANEDLIEINEQLSETEKALRASENRYRTLVDLAVDGILLGSKEGVVIGANECMSTITGIDREKLIGIHVSHLPFTPASLDKSPWRFDLLERGEIVISDRVLIHPDESEIHVEMRTRMMPDGTYQSIYRDITNRTLAEKKIKDFLEEKEIILREVHHRIKNNMNTVNSLLLLQACTLKDSAAVSALEDAGSRVQSMMILYDKLYQSADFDAMSAADYIPSLVDEILTNFPNKKSVKIEKKIDDFIIDSRKLQLLGIIINELLTNIMKYAYDERTDGLITVTAGLKDNNVLFVIHDDGKGIPESIDFENSTGFGLMLVNMMTKQLEGSIRIVREKGTRIEMMFTR